MDILDTDNINQMLDKLNAFHPSAYLRYVGRGSSIHMSHLK